jgi:hypothetical protein
VKDEKERIRYTYEDNLERIFRDGGCKTHRITKYGED